ncbi:MAG: family 16 glycosylhydrolase [Terrimicrobiaceae bacterium]
MNIKKFSLLAALTILPTLASPAAVGYISSITTTPALTPNANTGLTLTSITAGSATYTDLTAPTVTGSTGAINYGSSLSQPASANVALSDLNVGTGTYNTGSATQYSFSAIDGSTMFFVLMTSKGAEVPIRIDAYDGGAKIGEFSLSFVNSSLGALGTLSLNSTQAPSPPNPTTRTLYGFTFQASDFTFTGGNTVADMTAIRVIYNATDVQAVGIARSRFPGGGYTAVFADEFDSPSWSTGTPNGTTTKWRSLPTVSSKYIGFAVSDETCMSISNGHLINTLKFAPNTEVVGARSGGPVGMKNASGTALITVGTPGAQINTRSGLKWGNAGWVGLKFTTPAGGLTLSQLGRYNIAGSTGRYDVRIFDAADGADVAKAIVDLNGQPTGWVYAAITGGNVTLQGNKAYYLVTNTMGWNTAANDYKVDYWYDGNSTVTATGGITVNESTWGTWRSGSLFSVGANYAGGFTRQYGYWEARVKMPASGVGSWPSFCLYSANPGTLNEEIDIFEYYGTNYDSNTDGGAWMRNHNWGAGPTEGSANINPPASKPWLNYHVFGFQADPQYCVFYLDDVPVARFPTPTSYLNGPMYITLEHPIGGWWPLTGLKANAVLDVDWVRVWALSAAAPTVTSALAAAGATGDEFSYQIQGTHNPTFYNATGLPAGLSVNTLTGKISGSPTTTGTFNVAITASNANGSNTQTLVLTITQGTFVIVDNAAGGGTVALTGAWTTSTSTPGYQGSNYIHDGNTGRGTKNVKFLPNLPVAGNYKVYAWWTAGSNRSSVVTINVFNGSIVTPVTVNQQADGQKWNFLGTFNLPAGANNAYVQITNTGANGYVIADAVKLTHVP